MFKRPIVRRVLDWISDILAERLGLSKTEALGFVVMIISIVAKMATVQNWITEDTLQMILSFLPPFPEYTGALTIAVRDAARNYMPGDRVLMACRPPGAK